MANLKVTFSARRLLDVVKLHKQDRIHCPKGMMIVAEYVWSMKFLIVIAECHDLKETTKFTEQFSKYICDLEVAVISTLEKLFQQ